ncbi:retrovirus-related pol polyprotein from transposon TNT 1-94, partial [Tanacetum coccineum]
KYLGTIRFGNDQFAPNFGYGDLVQGNITIKKVYYVKGLNNNFFSVGQFCDADLEHRRLSHLNFDTINLLSKKDIVIGLPKLKYVKDQLCSSCELGKAKRSTFKTTTVPSSKGRLNLLHMDLCGPMWIESINGKKYILVIVDDDSRYTWTHFLRTKDETPKVLKDFLKMTQRNLQSQVITIRTDRGTEFLNQTLHAYLKKKALNIKLPLLEHLNRMTLSKDGAVMLLKLLKQCFQLLNFLYSFGQKLYQPHVTLRIDLSSSPYTKRHHITSSMTENLLLNTFASLNKSDPTPQLQNTSDHNRSELGIQDNNNEPSISTLVPNVSPPADTNAPSLQELDFLFSPLFDKYSTAGNQKPTTPTTNVNAEENNNDQAVDARIDENEFYNIFSTPIREESESYTRYVDNSNMHTFYNRHQSEHRWTKDRPLEQVHRNPSKPLQTRRQLVTDPKMCMFALTVSTAEPKNIKEAMADSEWIKAMQDELHQFDRLQV